MLVPLYPSANTYPDSGLYPGSGRAAPVVTPPVDPDPTDPTPVEPTPPPISSLPAPSYGVYIGVFPEPKNYPPRMRIVVRSSETGRTNIPIMRASVEVKTENGLTSIREISNRVPLRTGDGTTTVTLTPAGNGINQPVIYDYEAPFGQPVNYADIEYGLTGLSQPATLNVPDIWFLHLTSPDRSVRIPTMVDDGLVAGGTREVKQGLTYVLNRERPISVTDGVRKALTATMVVRTHTQTEADKLRRFLEDASTALVQIPVGLGWQIRSDYHAFGSSTEKRPVRFGPVTMREWSLPYTQVDQPIGGITPQRTYADVLGENSSYSDILAKYPSYQALLRG
jgi:hypothetical protein